ncbi:hypothetical protein WH47_05268 [Habropoda laboriosa]|uniref:Uncharacterized protein n=1 Tax=Habropoda laboriosa TaxID=597456 RepID=A0A0L7QVQ9_9HYME|nr:hypothetical protein WH47_05268 [Habropoda laboriosa]
MHRCTKLYLNTGVVRVVHLKVKRFRGNSGPATNVSLSVNVAKIERCILH